MPKVRKAHKYKIPQILLKHGYGEDCFDEVESSDTLADPVLLRQMEQ